MRHANRFWIVASAAMLAMSVAAAPVIAGPSSAGSAVVEAPAGEVIAGTWQHHKVTMNYFGITSLYTCDGIEEHVREILIYLGARKDVKVRATGCPGPYDTPSRSIWVNADFYSLAPAAETGSAGTVQAHWAALELNPTRPTFMGGGDCELIEQLKDLTLKNFSLRNVDYRTSCVPHEVVINGFSVTGQALKPATPVT